MRRAARVHCVAVSVAVAGSLAAAPPVPVACPPDARELVAEAKRMGERAQAAFDAGAFVDAAEAYARAVQVYPECDDHHLRRLTALEQAVASYRELHGGDPTKIGFLEKALALVEGYVADLRIRYGAEAGEREGFVHAEALRVEIDAAIATARPAPAPPPELEPAPAPEPEPEPAHEQPVPKDTRPLKLGIGISAGLAGAALISGLATLISIRRGGPLYNGILERTIRLGEPSTDSAHMCADPDDPELQDLCARRSGLVVGAIVSTIIFAAGAGTAAALAVKLKRAPGRGPAGARVTPLFVPGRSATFIGAAVRF